MRMSKIIIIPFHSFQFPNISDINYSVHCHRISIIENQFDGLIIIVIITHCSNIFITIYDLAVSIRPIDVVIGVINQHTFIFVQQVTPFENGYSLS